MGGQVPSDLGSSIDSSATLLPTGRDGRRDVETGCEIVSEQLTLKAWLLPWKFVENWGSLIAWRTQEPWDLFTSSFGQGKRYRKECYTSKIPKRYVRKLFAHDGLVKPILCRDRKG